MMHFMYVFYTNLEVFEHNTKMLNKLRTPAKEFKAIKRGPRGYRFETTQHGTIDSTQFLDNLVLKIGARVSMTFNVNTTDDLVNGALGKVIGFEANEKQIIEAVIIKFDSEAAGREQRQKYSQYASKYANENGTPILRYDLEYQADSKSGKSFAFKPKVLQFPLRLAWANTAHKMQGQTITAGSKLIVHWRSSFRDGMAYVMLGRCERLEDVYIVGSFNPKYIHCSKDALIESQKIEEIDMQRRELEEEILSTSLRVSYLNVQSLPAHVEDVKKVPQLMQSNIMALGETWLHEDQKIELDGLQSHFVNDGRGKGLAIYHNLEFCTVGTYKADKISAINVHVADVTFIFLYLSKSFSYESLEKVLDKWIDTRVPTAILGDVNWDWNSKHPMKSYLQGKRFKQLVKRATHEKGNILDHIYVCPKFSTKDFSTMQYSVTFTDHDVIELCLKV